MDGAKVDHSPRKPNIRPPRQIADDARISRGQIERHIARHGHDAQHVEVFRAGQGQKDRDGVILAGIGVDDDLAGHCRLSSIWPMTLTRFGSDCNGGAWA